MLKRSTVIAAAFAAISATNVSADSARDYISIVGSSTVYPFATVVVEQFGKTTKFKTPKVESTGSGGGLKLFCAGVGVQHPDITNASRRIKKSEYDQSDIVEKAFLQASEHGHSNIVNYLLAKERFSQKTQQKAYEKALANKHKDIIQIFYNIFSDS